MLWSSIAARLRPPILKNRGFCPICAKEVTFVARNTWLRDHYRCSSCHSIPRERALMAVLEMCYPEWRERKIHESSPVNRGVSRRLLNECQEYTPSQFFPNEQLGKVVNGFRCENLEELTFSDESIDIHVSQDVLEHVHHPERVFSEIARTLRPGGAHIFTVPLVNKGRPSEFRIAVKESGKVSYIKPPIYHGNPISDEGSLVTVDWGFDICRHIHDACGLYTQIFHIDDLSRGIRAEYIEVLVTAKLP